MSRLTREQYQAYSQEWRDCIDGIAQQGYIVTYERERLTIKDDKKELYLTAVFRRGVWVVSMVMPYFFTCMTYSDEVAIRWLHDWIELGENRLQEWREEEAAA